MSDELEQKSSLKDHLDKSYKLVVLRSDDFQEVRSFHLSLSNLYTLLSMIMLGFLLLCFALLTFSPLKRLIPGYGKIDANPEFLELIDKVDQIDQHVTAQETYLDALKTMLTSSESSVVLDNSIKTTTSTTTSPLPRVIQNVQHSGDESDHLYSLLGSSNVVEPVKGIISSNFQPSIEHFGIDILAPKNTPINAIMDGFVFNSGWDLETGYTIGIQHEGNILSFYKHNSVLLQEKGTFVRAGEAIAIIGNSGTLSNGPHVHFELWHKGKPVNPEDFLNFN